MSWPNWALGDVSGAARFCALGTAAANASRRMTATTNAARPDGRVHVGMTVPRARFYRKGIHSPRRHENHEVRSAKDFSCPSCLRGRSGGARQGRTIKRRLMLIPKRNELALDLFPVLLLVLAGTR